MFCHSIPIRTISVCALFSLQNSAYIIYFCKMMFIYQMLHYAFLTFIVRYSDIMHSIYLLINAYSRNFTFYYPIYHGSCCRFILYGIFHAYHTVKSRKIRKIHYPESTYFVFFKFIIIYKACKYININPHFRGPL